MNRSVRTLTPIVALALAAGVVGIVVGGTGTGLAAVDRPADQPEPADDHRHAAGGLDAHCARRHLDGQSDRVRLLVAPLRHGRRKLRGDQRGRSEDVRPEDGRPGKHASRAGPGAEHGRQHSRDVGADRGDPRGDDPHAGEPVRQESRARKRAEVARAARDLRPAGVAERDRRLDAGDRGAVPDHGL